eukprot:7271409-Prymnesium_polylepis.1
MNLPRSRRAHRRRPTRAPPPRGDCAALRLARCASGSTYAAPRAAATAGRARSPGRSPGGACGRHGSRAAA